MEENSEEKKRMRSPVKKKERLERRALTPETEDTSAKAALTPPPLFTHNKRGSIVWSTDGDEEADGEDEGDDDDKSSGGCMEILGNSFINFHTNWLYNYNVWDGFISLTVLKH